MTITNNFVVLFNYQVNQFSSNKRTSIKILNRCTDNLLHMTVNVHQLKYIIGAVVHW